MRWLRVIYPYGKIVAFFGILMMLPAAISLIYADGLALHYLASGAAVFAIGMGITFIGRPFNNDLFVRHGFVLINLIWLTLPIYATIPLLLVIEDMGFTKAYFEAASGLTASGATVLTGLDDLPPSINFWRGEMSWIGGMGLVVLATAILPLLGVGGSGTFQEELTGPNKNNKITPRIAETAKVLWGLYFTLTAVCAAAYWLAGMSVLDAMIHAFTTIGLGGFSSHDNSFAYFDSPLIEGIAIFFMILAGMNFVTHYIAMSNRDLRVYFKSGEWQVYICLILFAIAAVLFFLHMQKVYDEPMNLLRYGIFNTVSIITTTGYSNTDFGAWPLAAPLLMLLMANFTACSGSTGGGIKLVRGMIIMGQAESERTKLIHPYAYYNNPMGNQIRQKTLISILFFVLFYLVFSLLLTLFLAATGLDFLTAFSAAVASVSNTGPGLGEVGPAANYGGLSPAQIWACAFAMLFGRLELMSFFVVLNLKFWRF